jgi:hypothetical protein
MGCVVAFYRAAIHESPLIRPIGHLLPRRGEGTSFRAAKIFQENTSLNRGVHSSRRPVGITTESLSKCRGDCSADSTGRGNPASDGAPSSEVLRHEKPVVQSILSEPSIFSLQHSRHGAVWTIETRRRSEEAVQPDDSHFRSHIAAP